MYCPKKLQLNNFRLVLIPSNADYFKRFGFSSMPTNMYDSNAECPPMLQDKLSQLASAQSMLERAAELYEQKNKDGA